MYGGNLTTGYTVILRVTAIKLSSQVILIDLAKYAIHAARCPKISILNRATVLC